MTYMYINQSTLLFVTLGKSHNCGEKAHPSSEFIGTYRHSCGQLHRGTKLKFYLTCYTQVSICQCDTTSVVHSLPFRVRLSCYVSNCTIWTRAEASSWVSCRTTSKMFGCDFRVFLMRHVWRPSTWLLVGGPPYLKKFHMAPW